MPSGIYLLKYHSPKPLKMFVIFTCMFSFSAPTVLKQTGACQISDTNNTLLRKLNIKLVQVQLCM